MYFASHSEGARANMGSGIPSRVRQTPSADCEAQGAENIRPAEAAGGNSRSDTRQWPRSHGPRVLVIVNNGWPSMHPLLSPIHHLFINIITRCCNHELQCNSSSICVVACACSPSSTFSHSACIPFCHRILLMSFFCAETIDLMRRRREKKLRPRRSPTGHANFRRFQTSNQVGCSICLNPT